MKTSGKIAFLVLGFTFISSMSTGFACGSCSDKTHTKIFAYPEEEDEGNLSPIDWECAGCKKKKKSRVLA